MYGSRFIFLSFVTSAESGDTGEECVTWMLVSPNNRPLGRALEYFDSYESCRSAASLFRRQHGRIETTVSAPVPNGQWAWRVEVNGVPVAVSARTYLRQQECDYSVRRFLEALPSAELTDTVRTVRNRRALDAGATRNGSR